MVIWSRSGAFRQPPSRDTTPASRHHCNGIGFAVHNRPRPAAASGPDHLSFQRIRATWRFLTWRNPISMVRAALRGRARLDCREPRVSNNERRHARKRQTRQGAHRRSRPLRETPASRRRSRPGARACRAAFRRSWWRSGSDCIGLRQGLPALERTRWRRAGRCRPRLAYRPVARYLALGVHCISFARLRRGRAQCDALRGSRSRPHAGWRRVGRPGK